MSTVADRRHLSQWDDFIAGSLSDVTQYNNGISYDPLLLPDVEALLGDGASTGGFAS